MEKNNALFCAFPHGPHFVSILFISKNKPHIFLRFFFYSHTLDGTSNPLQRVLIPLDVFAERQANC